MAQEIIGIGSAANDGTGDPLREAFNKANLNFTELYNSVPDLSGYATDADLATVNAALQAEIDALEAATITYAALGEIVPATYDSAGIQAAFETAVANALAGTGPITVALYQDATLTVGVTVGNSVTHAVTRIPHLRLKLARGVQLRKAAADFSGSTFYAIQFTYCDNIMVEGGEIIGRVNDGYYADIIVPGSPANASTPNGASASGSPLNGPLFGDDGIRFMSCDDVTVVGTTFRNFGDSAWRVTPHTADTEEAAGQYGSKRIRFLNCNVFNSLQTSTTNTSGTNMACPIDYWMVNVYSENLNSNKWAHRGSGKKSRSLYILGCTNNGSLTGYEIDGYSQVFIDNTNIRFPRTFGISYVSNDTVSGVSSLGPDVLKITNTHIECDGNPSIAFRIAPDTQGSGNACPAVMLHNCSIENMSNASGVAVQCDGKFSDLYVDVHLKNFTGSAGIQARMRETKGAHLEVSGDFPRNDSVGHFVTLERKSASGVYTSATQLEDITIKLNNCNSGTINRFMLADGVKNLRLTGSARGAAAAIIFTNTLFGCEDLFVEGADFRTTGSAGLILNNITRGFIANSIIGCASSTPVTINSTCAGIEIAESGVKIVNTSTNAWATGGDGRGVTDSQGFLMASAARSGVNVDVTITHGAGGTDFTVPANAQRGFEFIRPDNTRVPIVSVTRQGATTLRAALGYDIGAAGTASGATTDAAGYAVGATTITLASAGTGAIVAGNYIKFGTDPNAYLVTTGDADVSGGGSVVIASPGLRVAIPGSATAITFAQNTLVQHDRPTFNQMNGAAFSNIAHRPIDNSPAVALLKRGAVAVA